MHRSIVHVPVLVLVLVLGSRARATTCGELVREAESHETAHEDDIAARRYTEALTLDSTCQKAYLGLAALRVRQGDGREAERVAAVALDHIPAMREALAQLARGKWIQGKREDAERDLETYARETDDRSAWRELAGWYEKEGKTPAQLGVWRRLLVLDPDSKEARTMVKALALVVSLADPVTSPAHETPTRKLIRQLAR